jgi:hypothetical protein
MPTTVADRQIVGGDWRFYLSEQTAKGAINTSPVFSPVRRTSGRFKKSISYTQSSEVSLDFKAVKQIQDTKELLAEVSTEATKQTIGFLLAAIHGTESVVTVTGTGIAATASGLTDSGNGFTNLAVGDFIFVTGFANALNNRTYRVSAKASNGSISTYPAPAATASAGPSITIATRKTYNANTPTYYAGQNRVIDDTASGDINYDTPFDGLINQQTLEVGETGVITSTISMMFEKDSEAETAISGQTDAAQLTDDPLSAVQNVANWYFDNVAALCVVKSANITVNNNYQTDQAAGCTPRMSRGQFEVTMDGASRSTIANSMSVRDLYYAGTRVAFGVEFDHGGGHKTVIHLPQVVLTEWDMEDGQNAISADTFSAAAEKSTALGYTIAVFRNWS